MIKSIYEGGSYRLTSPFGMRTLNGETRMHGGIDLVGESSKYITALVGGRVVVSNMVTDKTNATWQWGNYVCILGDDGRYYYYCHMAQRLVYSGASVVAGQRIGVEGNTGYSFGSHCHFEVREADGSTKISPAELLGVPNDTGSFTADELTAEEYINKIVEKVGYDNPAVVAESFSRLIHPFAREMWRKLYEALK